MKKLIIVLLTIVFGIGQANGTLGLENESIFNQELSNFALLLSPNEQAAINQELINFIKNQRNPKKIELQEGEIENQLKNLLDRGADINTFYDEDIKTTILLKLCKGYALYNQNHVSLIIQLLLKYGASTNISDFFQHTPLSIACDGKQIDLVKLLLDNGAKSSINAFCTMDRDTPLHQACSCENSNLVKLLLANGAQQTPNKHGQYPIHIASKNNNIEIIKLLFLHGALPLINKPTINNETPFYIACSQGNLELAQLLFDNGAQLSLDYPTSSGMMPLHVLCSNQKDNKIEFFNFILQKTNGRFINLQDRQSKTPLHYACYSNNLDIALILLQHPGIQVPLVLSKNLHDAHLSIHGFTGNVLIEENTIDPIYKLAEKIHRGHNFSQNEIGNLYYNAIRTSNITLIKELKNHFTFNPNYRENTTNMEQLTLRQLLRARTRESLFGLHDPTVSREICALLLDNSLMTLAQEKLEDLQEEQARLHKEQIDTTVLPVHLQRKLPGFIEPQSSIGKSQEVLRINN